MGQQAGLYTWLSVGNYSIPTANSNVDCADTQTGAGILELLKNLRTTDRR